MKKTLFNVTKKTKRLVSSRYVDAMFGHELVKDLKTVLGSRFNVLDMFNLETLKHPDSEYFHRKDQFIKRFNTPITLKRKAKPQTPLLSGDDNADILYINGMMTPYGLALHQASTLEKHLGEPVQLLHNQTDGLVKDLIECNQGRHGVMNEIAQRAMDVILQKLAKHESLTIVAHSQGAIITTFVLSLLAQSEQVHPDILKKVRYISLGAGFKNSMLPDSIFCEHFANMRDPVTKLGLTQHNAQYTGSRYIREARGHLFLADYILPMVDGDVFGNSWFEYKLRKGQFKQAS